MKFRRPCLFETRSELIVWLAWPIVFLALSVVGIVRGSREMRYVAAAFAAVTVGGVLSKFLPRLAEMRTFAYRTRQGVGVIAGGGRMLARELVEAGIGRAIEAHCDGRVPEHGKRPCRAESLDGYGMKFVPTVFYAGAQLAAAVTEGGWMVLASPSWFDDATMRGLVTHEAARVLLISAGVPVQLHEAVMRKAGTW